MVSTQVYADKHIYCYKIHWRNLLRVRSNIICLFSFLVCYLYDIFVESKYHFTIFFEQIISLKRRMIGFYSTLDVMRNIIAWADLSFYKNVLLNMSLNLIPCRHLTMHRFPFMHLHTYLSLATLTSVSHFSISGFDKHSNICSYNFTTVTEYCNCNIFVFAIKTMTYTVYFDKWFV